MCAELECTPGWMYWYCWHPANVQTSTIAARTAAAQVAARMISGLISGMVLLWFS